MLLAEPETARWMIHCQKAFLGSILAVLPSTVGSEGRWNDGRDYCLMGTIIVDLMLDFPPG